MNKQDKIQAIEKILDKWGCADGRCIKTDELAIAIEEAIGIDEDEIKTSLKHNYHRFNIGGNPPYSMIAKAISTNKEVIRIGSGQNE